LAASFGSSRVTLPIQILAGLSCLSAKEGFQVVAATVTKRITFASILRYARFQLIATPMSANETHHLSFGADV
jgi:hypothetical protein